MGLPVLEELYRAFDAAFFELLAASDLVSGSELAAVLRHGRLVRRQLDFHDLSVVARLKREGFFAEKNLHPAPAVMELAGLSRAEAARRVRLASDLFPTATLDGQPVEPRLPATASAFGSWLIDSGHANVIRVLLGSASARRLAHGMWVDVEKQLADWALHYSCEELVKAGRALIENLDQDGAEPDRELDDQINELHLTRSADGLGGWIRGRLDAATFDALVQVIEGLLKPHADEGKSLAERQADALGELCEGALDDGELPEAGGQSPHVTVILDYATLREGLRGATLTASGCRVGPREIRRLACDAGIIPVVLGGKSEPLDVGRSQRLATPHQRRALAVRDGACAHPGCETPSKWCHVHHIHHWENLGASDLDNMVLLCRTHHRMVHQSGWTVRIRNGLPEFITPRWIDPDQVPRRKSARHETLCRKV